MISKSPGRPRKRKPPTPEKTYRVCKNCPSKFEYTREDHVFCKDSCRKEFHRHGIPNFAMLADAVKAKLTPEILADVKRLTDALEQRLEGLSLQRVTGERYGEGLRANGTKMYS